KMSSKTKIVILSAGIRDLRRIEDLFEAKGTWHIGNKRTPPLGAIFHEHLTHRLLVFDSEETMVLLAYAEFSNHPPIPVLCNDLWLYWLEARFCLDLPISLINTMFLHFFICRNEYPNMLKQVVQEVFYGEHKVNFIMVVRPPDQTDKEYEPALKLGKTFYPMSSKLSEQMHQPSIIIIRRKEIMPAISFRKALPEDNDDIVEMIDSEDPHLRKTHGDYYIAEQLLNVDGSADNDKIIIAEFEEEIEDNVKGAGLMWLSDSIDVADLATNFHLNRLGNLARYTPGGHHGHVHFDVFSVEKKAYKELYAPSKMEQMLIEYSPSHIEGHTVNEGQVVPSKKLVLSKFKHIYDELRHGRYYVNAFQERLEIGFDMPPGENLSPENIRAVLKNARNGFLLKMFQLHPLVRSEYTFFSLSAMFSAFPEHDYCVTKVPTTTTMSPCQRELLRFFLSPVPYRPNSSVTDNLFVAHRSTLFGDLSIYRVERHDVEDIKLIITSHYHRRETVDAEEEDEGLDPYIEEVLDTVQLMLNDIFDNPRTNLSCFMIRCGTSKNISDCSVVGFVFLKPFFFYDDLIKFFMLPQDQFHLTHNRGEVLMIKLHPFFQMWADPIFRTVALHENYLELFYFNHFWGTTLPNDLTSYMMPIEPRRMKKNLFDKYHFNLPRHPLQQSNTEGCSSRVRVFCHNLKVNKYLGFKGSLVVVGFSETCRCFLRIVIFAWNTKDLHNYQRYNCIPSVDITVVVPHGVLEAAYDCDFNCKYCGGHRYCYVNTGNLNPFVRDSMQRMDLRQWVRFVPGNIQRIDRENNMLELVSGCKIHYEKLLLMDASRYGFEDREFQVKSPPLNYVKSHHRLDRIIFYHKLQEIVSTLESFTIIVYGYGMCVYESIHFIVTHGCPAEHIIYVQPNVPQGPEVLLNPETDSRLDPIFLDMIADMGVTIYLSTNYQRLVLDVTHTFIEKVEFIGIPSRTKLTLTCDLFVNFNTILLTSEMERILSECDIKMKNRKIVVNSHYCTNDPNIYAGGRYVEIEPTPNFQFNYISAQERAEKLAYELNVVKGPMQARYSRPHMFTGMLPMNYQIIKVIQPRPLMVGQLTADYAESMTTFDDGDFCRVRINSQLVVIEIVCVTKKEKRLYFLEYFCGKHVLLLNDLRNRYQAGWITNFLEFFQRPWTELIMHDRFEELQLKNRRVLLSMLLMNTGEAANATQKLRGSVENIQRQRLEENVIEFVRTNRRDFIHAFALPEDWGVFNL
ncbi:hypothetical protein KR026_007225, partial [Drosophila bipectinata]